MSTQRNAGRAWSNDIAQRPEGYAQTWTQWVEGPDAQAQFDALVLHHATACDVLDCGCGDGMFTLQVARQARQMVGLDFSEGLLRHAQHHADENQVRNITFIHSHARIDVPLSQDAFDLAYSRRGPNITLTVPNFIRENGLLIGLHPLENVAQEERYRDGLRQSGLNVERFEGIDDVIRLPTLADLAGYLNRFPGMPDVRQPEHHELLVTRANELQHPDGGYAVKIHYLLWLARKTRQ